DTLWLTIDEKSMLTTPLLAHLSHVTGIVCTGQQSVDVSTLFGRLNVMLLGDFHQFPPVAAHGKELYATPPINNKLCLLGKNLYEQFDIVIKLKQQMRIWDPVWNAILDCSRTGDCTADDLAEMRKLILGSPECALPNFTQSPWDNVILVTPRNSVCTLWNEAMLSHHCRHARQTHYIVYALDSCKNRPLTRAEQLVIAHLKLEDTNRLPNRIDLAVGMKAMVLENIAPNADLANGSRGTISDIILDPRE
ncbi:hypothetical protein EDB86DRAFT_2758806, partial [Lactarius hatsudake]